MLQGQSYQGFHNLLMSMSNIFFRNTIKESNDSLRKTIKVSNSLDPDQDRCSVGPDLGPNLRQYILQYTVGKFDVITYVTFRGMTYGFMWLATLQSETKLQKCIGMRGGGGGLN